jgi:O-antigen biosynthesis protein
MYDSWHVMVELKKYLTSDAQFIASIPNIRHLPLLSELVNNGAWTYVDAGLLDITHIRFFTQREVIRFFNETGYQVKSINRYIGRDLQDFYNANVNSPNITVKLGRMVIENLSKDEFAEFCCRQLFVVAAPRP